MLHRLDVSLAPVKSRSIALSPFLSRWQWPPARCVLASSFLSAPFGTPPFSGASYSTSAYPNGEGAKVKDILLFSVHLASARSFWLSHFFSLRPRRRLLRHSASGLFLLLLVKWTATVRYQLTCVRACTINAKCTCSLHLGTPPPPQRQDNIDLHANSYPEQPDRHRHSENRLLCHP